MPYDRDRYRVNKPIGPLCPSKHPVMGGGEDAPRDQDEYRADARRAAGDANWTLGEFAGVIVVSLAIIAGTGFATRGFGLLPEKAFAPAEKQVHHDALKESQGYRDVMSAELDALFLQYHKADASGRAAIRSAVLHKVASFDTQKLPTHLQNFVNELRSAR